MQIEILRLSHDGRGIGYLPTGKIAFVENALPGEVVTIETTLEKPKFVEATVKHIEFSSPLRVEPICSVYEKCGGCDLQHLNAKEHSLVKKQWLIESLKKFAQFELEASLVEGVSFKNTFYRRRASVKVKDKKIGFFERSSHNIVDVEPCKILSRELLAEVLKVKKQLTHKDEGELQFTLDDAKKVHIAILKDPSKALARFQTSAEQMMIEGCLVSTRAFLQAHEDVSKVYQKDIFEAVSTESRSAKIYDLYAGFGSYSLNLQNHGFSDIEGVEENGYAVESFPSSITSHKKKVEEWVKTLEKSNKPVVLLLNPPRIGVVGSDTFELILSKLGKSLKVILYLSCDHVTLARDLKIPLAKDFKIETVKLYDAFPNTRHFETLVVLKR